jgi:hypothetical protein
VDQAALEARVAAEVARRLQPALQEAVAESEARQASQTRQLLAQAHKDFELERQADRLAFAENYKFLQKRFNVLYTRTAFGEGQ